MKITKGTYNTQHSSTHFEVIKVHYQDETKVEVKAAFVLKNSGQIVECKNYTIEKKNITSWTKIYE